MPIKEFVKFKFDFVGFIQHYFPASWTKFKEKQLELVHDYQNYLSDPNGIEFLAALNGAKNTGKTYVSLLGILHAMLCYDFTNLRVVSGTGTQAQVNIFNQLKMLIQTSELCEYINATNSAVRYIKKEHNSQYGSNITLLVFNKNTPDSIAGQKSSSFVYILVDEANNLDESFFTQIYGMLGGARTVLMCSANPDITQGAGCSYFGRVFIDKKKLVSTLNWRKYHFKREHRIMSEHGIALSEQAYANDIVALRRFVDGEFPETDPSALLFPHDLLYDSIATLDLTHDRIIFNGNGAFGVDVACGRNRHSSVIVYRYGFTFYVLLRSATVDPVHLTKEIAYYNSLCAAPFFIDENGAGSFVISALERLNIKSFPINAQRRALDSYECYDRRTQLYHYISLLVKQKLLKIYLVKGLTDGAGKALLDECDNVVATYLDGRLYVEAKSRSSKKSPDILDALSFTFAHVNKQSFNESFKRAINLKALEAAKL